MTTTDSPTGQARRDAHSPLAGGGHNFPVGHQGCDTQSEPVNGGPDNRNGQTPSDAHGRFAVAGSTPESTKDGPEPILKASVRDQAGDGHCIADTQRQSVVAPTPSAPAIDRTAAKVCSPVLTDPFLRLAADVLDDLERVRIANENRLRQLTRDETDKDGQERGFGLSTDHPDVARLAALVDGLAKAEHSAELNLKRALRTHPLGPWVRSVPGLGEKQAARLLAAVGDPYIRPELTYPDGRAEPARPRRVSELWAYCGYHVLRTGQYVSDTHDASAGSDPTSARQSRSADQSRFAGGTIVPASQRRSDFHTVAAGGAPTSARQVDDDAHPNVAGGTHPPTGHSGNGPQVSLAGGDPNGSDSNQIQPGSQLASVGVAATRSRGHKTNWSPTAKMRTHLAAESCMKQLRKPCTVDPDFGYATHVNGCRCSPYRVVYDHARAKYAHAVHHTPCVRCGPAGKPAPVGSPLGDGHKLARALRIVSKEILKDLWREARRIHSDEPHPA